MFKGKYAPDFSSNQPLIAVFWSDVNSSAENAGNVSFRETNNAVLLQRALEDIQRAYPAVSNIDHLFIATWYQVRPLFYNTDKVQSHF